MSKVSGRAAWWTRLALGLALAIVVSSCGSGAVSGPAPVVTLAPITVTPASATLYSDLPTTFVVSGGNGSYIATSSDQNVLPVATTFDGNVLTVVPNQVASDTPVTLTFRDTASTTPVSATLMVKPRTVSNIVTVTPSATTCGTSVCSGGDAQVSVVLTQGGLPLAGRQVRFDVVSGDFRLITSSPGLGETLALSTITTTDATGTARVRVRVLADAVTQTGLLDMTDLGSGLTRHTTIPISPLGNSALSAQPTEVDFVGRDSTSCAVGISADVIVTGGRPPYSISQSGVFGVSPTVLARSSDRFTVSALGLCSTGVQIAVVDSLGASTSVTAINLVAAAITFPALVVSPKSVTLTSCTDRAQVSIAGGRGSPYQATSSNSAVTIEYPGTDYVIIHRLPGSGIPPNPTTVSISDGRSVQSVDVNLTGAAALPCP